MKSGFTPFLNSFYRIYQNYVSVAQNESGKTFVGSTIVDFTTPPSFHYPVRWPATFVTVKQENSFVSLAKSNRASVSSEFELRVRIPRDYGAVWNLEECPKLLHINA